MATIRCSKGHLYDNSQGNCPICAQEAGGWGFGGNGFPDSIQETQPASQSMSGFGSTASVNSLDAYDKTMPISPASGTIGGSMGFGGGMSDVGATEPVGQPEVMEKQPMFITNAEVDSYDPTEPEPINGEDGFDPVVGWLICTKGPNRGRDYRLHSGTNFVGRSKEMDVCIEHDQTISKRNAASISYDDRSRTFFIQKGEVRNLLYLNGKPVRSDADITMYDRIEIGATELVFVPLCSDTFNWQDN